MSITHASTASHVSTRQHGSTFGLYRPLIDILETNDSVFVIAEMPGIAAENVDITLERQILTIYGRALVEKRSEVYNQFQVEYSDGDYERVLAISEDINKSQIKASHKDGVLTLELPKTAPDKIMRVNVNT